MNLVLDFAEDVAIFREPFAFENVKGSCGCLRFVRGGAGRSGDLNEYIQLR